MPISIAAPYACFALLSVALCFITPFNGIGLIRALPTALLAGTSLPYTRNRFGFAISVAVALGAVGDFSLAAQMREGFVPGLVAFLLGHLFYLWAFARDMRPTRRSTIVLLLALAGLVPLGALTVTKMARAGELILIGPVVVYMFVLALTMAVCLSHQSPTRWIAAGGVIFVISDAHIAVNHILRDTPLIFLTVSGYTTYYLAQFLLVHGAARETAAVWKPGMSPS